MITDANVHLDDAHKTPQFWLIWGVLLLNVSAGIGVIGMASPMLQEIFGGSLVGRPGIGFLPACLGDMFGTQFVGAIHGRILTAWSTAGIFGPIVVNYIREAQIAHGVPRAQVYDFTMYTLAGFLVAGSVCNALVRPVAKKWHMSEAVAQTQARSLQAAQAGAGGSFGIGKGGATPAALFAWACVGGPILWGAWVTLGKVSRCSFVEIRRGHPRPWTGPSRRDAYGVNVFMQ